MTEADQKLNSGYRNSLIAKQKSPRELEQGLPDMNHSNDFYVIISRLGLEAKRNQVNTVNKETEVDVKGRALGLGINVSDPIHKKGTSVSVVLLVWTEFNAGMSCRRCELSKLTSRKWWERLKATAPPFVATVTLD